MIHSILESTIRTAINNADNYNEDGSINWSFVDADCYMDCRALYKNDKEYYDTYGDLQDKVFAEIRFNAVNNSKQLKMEGI